MENFNVGQQELKVCGITLDEYKSRIELLNKFVQSSVIKKNIESFGATSNINRICGLSVLLEKLQNVYNSKKVFSQIKDLWDSDDALFELITGGFMLAIGENPLFQVVIKTPKDVMIRDKKINIECKNFQEGEKMISAIKGFTGQLNRNEQMSNVTYSKETLPQDFKLRRKIGATSVPRHLGSFFEVNRYEQFIQNGIEGKNRQLLPNICNIISLNTTRVVDNIQVATEATAKFLQNNQYEKISGILLFHSMPSRSEWDKILGFVYKVRLVLNEQAKIKIPQDLVSKIKGETFTVSLRNIK
ncbi:MAG: hypothetical protein US81_C0039G0002 [Parcubacteria group bacterium GW2011_GWE2_38_18]|nr:MAG: hypothetical protein US81_C0039G0002 [Parcubacteria group bacterium GW2011_GWE2_38_18]